MGFTIQSFEEHTTIGQELKSARRRLAISLDEVSVATKIQKKYLKAIEEDRWQDLPEPLYTRNFLRSYVQFLGKDVEYVLSKFSKERGCCDFIDGYKTPRQKVKRARLMVTSRIIKLGVLAVITLSVMSYLGFQVRSVMQPPMLVVETPTDGSTTDHPVISVSGEIKEEGSIYVNKEVVLPSMDGTFRTEVTLERGMNIITIEGKKRYSNPATIYRTVIFDTGSSEISKLSLE